MSQILKDYDLTTTEWLMIGTVIDAGAGGVRISKLADTLGVEMPVITNLVQKALHGGWVESIADSQDRRAKRITVSTVGAERACIIEGQLRDATKDWISGVNSVELSGYFAVVGALSKKYG